MSKPTMIIPCCGMSSRFPGLKKQFMIHPSGIPLPIYSASGVSGCNRHIFVFLKEEFEEVYGDKIPFEKKAEEHGLINPHVVLMNYQTTSQVETVRFAVEGIGIAPIYIKDNDNYFVTTALSRNIVSVEDIRNGDFELRNKSFSMLSEGVITGISERGIISNWINCGGYGFQSSHTFMKYSYKCHSISGVIFNIMNAGGEFSADGVTGYEDYGTMKAWIDYLYKKYS